MGLRKAKAVNIAMQMKLLRKIMNNKNNPWVRLITAKYIKNDDILSYKKKGNYSCQ